MIIQRIDWYSLGCVACSDSSFLPWHSLAKPQQVSNFHQTIPSSVAVVVVGSKVNVVVVVSN
jgi:hypothetical protein